MNVTPLLAIPSPRDLTEFKTAMDTVTDIDKLWIKYCPAPVTYPKIREEFLSDKNRKYTHLIICPDDLLMNRDKLQILIDDYENVLTKKEQNTTVLSGYCNVDTSEHSSDANICIEYVTPKKQGRRYKYVTLTAIEAMKGQIKRESLDRREQENRLQAGQDKITHYDDDHPNEFNRRFLLNVCFAGFGMIMIPRKILEKVDLRNDAVDYPLQKEQGCYEDVMFCHHCLEKGFVINVDIRAKFNHLKFNDVSTMELIQMKEKEKPFMRYEFAADSSKDKKTEESKNIPIIVEDPTLLKLSPPKPAREIYGSYSH